MTSGLIIQCEHEKALFKFYGGTLDASGRKAQYSTAVYMKSGTMEMYGGTIIGGETYGSGSGCMAVGAASTFEMFGGTFKDGYCKAKTINESAPSGGGLICVSGVATIHDGEFIGGKSDYNGGNLYVKSGATLKLLGGTVSGGSCIGKDDTKGAGLFLEANCEVVLGGDVQITDNTGSNFNVTNTATIKIDTAGLSGAKIGVSGLEGVFIKGSFTEDVLQNFVSDDPSMKVVLTAEGIALEKA